ncbi:integrase core domain-containing protein [Xanthomonas arboricola]|uniref:integrase core domain-containing protein n=1 Tax=Xanthomonas arboricola TaxID=56448 RepID=UPI001BAFC12E|nr:integrase core domain-containing protein [Xanthomonas arboricola]QUI80832.1 transposase [Xanthomonas arboricola pv. corylina]
MRDQYDLTQRIQIENGSNFFSTVMDRGAYTDGLTADYSRPGKLISNPFMESFNGRFRDECLNTKGVPVARRRL